MMLYAPIYYHINGKGRRDSLICDYNFVFSTLVLLLPLHRKYRKAFRETNKCTLLSQMSYLIDPLQLVLIMSTIAGLHFLLLKPLHYSWYKENQIFTNQLFLSKVGIQKPCINCLQQLQNIHQQYQKTWSLHGAAERRAFATWPLKIKNKWLRKIHYSPWFD